MVLMAKQAGDRGGAWDKMRSRHPQGQGPVVPGGQGGLSDSHKLRHVRQTVLLNRNWNDVWERPVGVGRGRPVREALGYKLPPFSQPSRAVHGHRCRKGPASYLFPLRLLLMGTQG